MTDNSRRPSSADSIDMVTPSRAKFWTFLVAFAAVTGLAVSSVGRSLAAQDTAAADVLWLPTGAQLEDDGFKPKRIHNGRSIYVDGSASVVFSIESDQEDLSRRIVEHFATAGWRQRNTQFLNPQSATSFEQGWQRHGGGLNLSLGRPDQSMPYQPYRRWEGEWEGGAGSRVTYSIGGQGRRLRGIASYIPRSLREEVLRKIEWQKSMPPKPAAGAGRY